jgi:hypothetical protein
MRIRPVERLLGVALVAIGWHLTRSAWLDAGATASFSLFAAAAGPALAVVGLGVTFFRSRHSALADLFHLETRWAALVLLALLVGALDVGHLFGW